MYLIGKLNILVITLFILISCEDPLNTQPEYYNHSLFFNLTANAEDQHLYLFRMLNADERIGPRYNYWEFTEYSVPDADISIRYRDRKINLVELIDDNNLTGYTTTEDTDIQPNDSCHLSCLIGTQTIAGETIVPSDFSIIHPLEASILSGSIYRPLNIIWERSITSYGYIITVILEADPYDSSNNFTSHVESFFVTDTAFTFNKPESLNANCTIEIKAVDKNLYEHLYGENRNSGLSGAYGYFGSSLLKKVNIKFVY